MNNFPTHPTSRRLSDALNPLCPTKTPQCNVGELCAETPLQPSAAPWPKRNNQGGSKEKMQ